jgi:hypothetical protein
MDKGVVKAVMGQELMGVRVGLDEVSLMIPDGVGYEKVEGMLGALKGLHDCVKWWIGDLLEYAERSYGEKYSQLLDATEFEYKTLRNIRWTVGRVGVRVRRKELTFWHHAEVAGLVEVEQERYLGEAVGKGWSVRQLREAVKSGVKGERKVSRVEAYEVALKLVRQVIADGVDGEVVQERVLQIINDVLAVYG